MSVTDINSSSAQCCNLRPRPNPPHRIIGPDVPQASRRCWSDRLTVDPRPARLRKELRPLRREPGGDATRPPVRAHVQGLAGRHCRIGGRSRSRRTDERGAGLRSPSSRRTQGRRPTPRARNHLSRCIRDTVCETPGLRPCGCHTVERRRCVLHRRTRRRVPVESGQERRRGPPCRGRADQSGEELRLL